MNTLDFLSQAYRLDLRIDSKLEQIASLNELSTKCTTTITDMPSNPNLSISSMADAIVKIVDLQTEIDRDIHRLIDIKRQIVASIKVVDNKEYQTLLELRFLCGCKWRRLLSRWVIASSILIECVTELEESCNQSKWRVKESCVISKYNIMVL